MNNFRELKVWQKAMSLVTEIYKISSEFPNNEQFGLTSQMRCSSISIPSNIAEGFGRNTKNEFVRFLQISLGSLFELQTQLEISRNLTFLSVNLFEKLEQNTIELEKMLKALIKSLKNNRN